VIIGVRFSSRFNMKVTSYFTDGEIEIALAIVAGILEDQKALEELSVDFDAGDKLIHLKDKIHFYFGEMKSESPQE
jgi:hypothetical protein